MKRLLALVAVAAVLSACGSFQTYAAKVNGEAITQEELDAELDAILENKAYLDQVDAGFSGRTGQPARGEGRNTFNTVFVAALIDRRIGFELIHQEVRRRRITVTAAERAQTRQNLERSLGDEVFKAFPKSYQEDLVRVFSEVAALQRALGENTVDEAAVKEFYEQNQALFAQTCVRHILVDTQAKAAAIKARIAAGEDFAAIAKAESADKEGPEGGSAAKGGDLGCLTQGNLVPEFERAMAALAPGQVSDPVQTQFGFHIIQVTERKATSLAEAAPQIRENLEAESPDVIQRFVPAALARARIEVNPRYGRFVKSGPNPGVRPPRLPGGAGPADDAGTQAPQGTEEQPAR